MTTKPDAHVRLRDAAGLAAWTAAEPTPTLGRHCGHARLRGPFTAAGSLLRAIVPGILERDPALARRYDLEILAAAPDLGVVLPNTRRTLTSEADPMTRTRYYPHDRVRWIGNGLVDLVLAEAAARGGGQTLLLSGVDDLDATDAAWLAALLRRSDPAVLRLVLASSTDPASGDDVSDVAAYVAGACLSADPAARSAYDALTEARRKALHDAAADRLEATGEQVWRLGAIPFHRERGSRPELAVQALTGAMQHCLMAGFYDHLVRLGTRVRALVPWDSDPVACWLATVKMTIAYQAMGLPDEAMALFDDACSLSTMPSVHMQSAYGRAMVYTRYYEEDRRDLRKAKGLVNTAIALAGLSPDAQRRAYNRTFNENGLALVDMHLGNLAEAVQLIEDGIARLDAEVEAGRFLLHRSVLRYNHAQLMVRTGDLTRAVEEYTAILAEDPNHPDYWFDRAGLMERLGRDDDALADYTAAIRVSPPYPEPHYNRANLLMKRGDAAAALADLTRVLDLEPDFLDAYVNRAALLMDAGDLDGAARDVRAGLSLDPAQPHLLCLAGLLHHEASRLDEAAASYRAALDADPALAGAWANLGAVLFEAGERAEAVRALERAIDLDDDPDVRANLALCVQ
jgi:tetratricopeptide (TPR) repeat protein